MNELINNQPIARRTTTIVFVIDTSGSMSGAKIGTVNQAMREVLPIMDEISQNNADAEIKLAVLEFSSGCEWMYNSALELSDFKWQDREAGGITDMGLAMRELSKKLSKNELLSSASGSYAPVLIMMTDGSPTDDFEGGLKKLQANNWYKAAIKIAIAIGDANKENLNKFTGSPESVIKVDKIDALKKIIKMVSVTSSRIGSQSSTSGNETKQDIVNKVIKDETEKTDGAHLATETTTSPDGPWE